MSRRPTKRPKSLIKEDIAAEINRLLGYPLGDTRSSKGYKLVTAVVQAMTEALLKGDSISVKGFGRFEWKVRKARKITRLRYFYGTPTAHYEKSGVIPAKRYVAFTPCHSLKRDMRETELAKEANEFYDNQ